MIIQNSRKRTCVCSTEQNDNKGMGYDWVQAFKLFRWGVAFLDLVNIDSDYQEREFFKANDSWAQAQISPH